MSRHRPPDRGAAEGAGVGAYRVLLRLYPRDFRERFGDEMTDVVRERVGDAARARGAHGALAAWARVAADLLHSAAAERVAAARRRRHAAPALHPPDPEATGMLRSIARDARHALRGMARRPGFSAVVLATLALGIGVNVAIFSVVNGVLLRPLPYPDAERVLQVSHTEPAWSVSEPEFMDYRRDAPAFSRLAAFAGADAHLTGDGEAEQIGVARVSDGFFQVLGVTARVGRTFLPEEEVAGGPPVVVLSHGLWQRRYGGDPAIVGRAVTLEGKPVTVVGVMPPRFDYPSRDAAAWAPLRLRPESLWTRNNHYLTMVGRLAPGATVAGASAELSALARRFVRDFPETYTRDAALVPVVRPVQDALVGPTRPYLLALVGAVAFVLLIACVNVANLFLARGETRRREIAVRAAIGAARGRLVREALTESVLYAAVGGALGLALAWLGVRGLLALAPDTLPRRDEVGADAAVLLFALLVTSATGLLFGIAPALRGARGEAAETLRQGGRTPGQARGLARARAGLVVAEVALAVVTLCGAGLLLRSLWSLRRVELGFTAERVLTARVALPRAAYPQERRIAFHRELEQRLRALPGVVAVGAIPDLPVADGQNGWSINVDGRVLPNIADAPWAAPEQVTPGLFRALEIPVLRGRGFTDDDREGAAPVTVVNEALAAKLWPGQDPLGHTIRMFGDTTMQWARVVGVVRDVRARGFLDDPPPTMYFPYAQSPRTAYLAPATMSLIVKTAGDPAALGPAVRAAVRALDPGVPVLRVETMTGVVAESVGSRRFGTQLVAGFAALALALAGIGIYGVMSYDVSQRAYEIGVRRALGAQRRQVLALTLVRGARLAALGLAVGVLGALAVTRALGAVLVGVGATDPVTFGAVALALAAVAGVASYLPARRAAAVNPVEAIRGE